MTPPIPRWLSAALTSVALVAAVTAEMALLEPRVPDPGARRRRRRARPDGGGLVGLADRLAVLDGQLRVESPAEGGTLVAATLPIPG